MKWVITVANYGSFFFDGNEDQAEEMRCHKANWEGGIGRKRLAGEDEVISGKITECDNHPNFSSKYRRICSCEKCKGDVK